MKKLTSRSYTAAKALPTTKQIELINKKEFAKAVLDVESKTFIVYVLVLKSLLSRFLIYPDRLAQIVFLLTKEVTIPDKYYNFTDVISEKKALVLPERTNLNEHAIELEVYK